MSQTDAKQPTNCSEQILDLRGAAVLKMSTQKKVDGKVLRIY